jgi:hypothetical protein
MIKVIRDSLFSQFYYWRKPVMDRFDRHHQDGYFMTGIGTQYWFTRWPNSDRNRCQSENRQPTPGRYTPKVIQIPIAPQHFALPWLRPAVSSLVACPTPPSDLRANLLVHCYVGRHLTTLNISGPLARTIADIRLGFEAMAAEDLRDPWWTPVPINLPLKRKRAALCINPDGLEVAPEVERALRESAKILQADGWQVDEVDCPSFRKPAELQAVLWLSEMRKVESTIKQENDPDALFVYEQMKNLSPPTDLDGFMDALQGRAT